MTSHLIGRNDEEAHFARDCGDSAGSLSFAVEAVSAVHGTISKIDSSAKTIVVKTAEGTEHTFRFIAKTTVHGTEAGAKDTFRGLKEGTEVVAHYTVSFRQSCVTPSVCEPGGSGQSLRHFASMASMASPTP
jgi:hypothetical protein